MKKAIVVSGSGGQGVMSIGIMLAQTAVAQGKCATYLPEYGPEQRGGSAKCTVVIDDNEIVSPLVKKSNIFIALNEQGYKAFIKNVDEGGVLIYNSSRVTSPITRTDITAVSVPADDIANEIGSPKAANIVMLGALIEKTGIVDLSAFTEHLEQKFASKKPIVMELNRIALAKGVECAK